MPKFTKNGTRVTIWLKRPTYKILSAMSKARDVSRTKFIATLLLEADRAAKPILTCETSGHVFTGGYCAYCSATKFTTTEPSK